MNNYDSAADTNEHISHVRTALSAVTSNLDGRAWAHDMSKFSAEEKPIFDEYTPKLRALTYGSPEYQECLMKMQVALDHHYANNSHHPEHYSKGIDGMSLLDLIEMLCDWRAAIKRHANGSLCISLEINRKRFKISPQLQSILENTAHELGWLEESK